MFCNNLIAASAFAADYRNSSRLARPLESLHKLSQKLGPNLKLSQFVKAVETQFKSPHSLLVSKYINKKNGQKDISFTVRNNKIELKSGGANLVIEVIDDKTVLVNGTELYREDLVNSKVLLSKLDKAMRTGTPRYSFWQVIIGRLLMPNAQAAIEMNNSLLLGGAAIAVALTGVLLWYFKEDEPQPADQINITNITKVPRRHHYYPPYYSSGGTIADPYPDEPVAMADEEPVYFETKSEPPVTAAQ
jgi:hypothetical protein